MIALNPAKFEAAPDCRQASRRIVQDDFGSIEGKYNVLDVSARRGTSMRIIQEGQIGSGKSRRVDRIMDNNMIITEAT
jgi:hypothetical protein